MGSTVESGDRAPRAYQFDRSVLPLVVFALVGIALAVGFTSATEWLVSRGALSRTAATRVPFALAAFGPLAVLAWVVLRWEGVRPAAVGVERRHLLPGVALVAGIWLGAHLLTVVSRVVAGAGVDVALGIPPAVAPADWYTSLVAQLVVVGVVEEFAFRGYFQNKFVALFGGGEDRRRAVAGILTATALFALWHVPQRVVVQGASVESLPPMLLALGLYGLFFGVTYELTRNVVLTGVLHGTFNFQPILLAGAGGRPDLTVTAFVLPLALLAIWGYRRWATRAHPEDFEPQSLG